MYQMMFRFECIAILKIMSNKAENYNIIIVLLLQKSSRAQ